ncbi:MAG: hypothetical protein KBS99_04245 [Prevotellaceae bacterium]|nr:hypothetical protein [Candidatus Colivivens caballi]
MNLPEDESGWVQNWVPVCGRVLGCFTVVCDAVIIGEQQRRTPNNGKKGGDE